MLEELKKRFSQFGQICRVEMAFFGTKISDKEKKFDIDFFNTCNLACGKTE